MTKLYAHPDGPGYFGGICAPRDFKTRSELLSPEGLYAYRRAKVRKGEIVCDYCGQKLLAVEGSFHVLKWRGDGGYKAADALASYARRDAAERHAERAGADYVVRAW